MTLSVLLDAAARIPGTTPLQGTMGKIFYCVLRQLCLDLINFCCIDHASDEVRIALEECIAEAVALSDEAFSDALPIAGVVPLSVDFQTIILKNLAKWPHRSRNENLALHRLSAEAAAYTLLRSMLRCGGGVSLVPEAISVLRRWWNIMSESEAALEENWEQFQKYRRALASLGTIGAGDALSWCKESLMPIEQPFVVLFDPL
jgi:hypothetical protein